MFTPLWSESYVLALPQSHDLRHKPKLSLGDLAGLPLIGRCNCENAGQASDLGFKPEIVAIATTEEWAMALVEAGVGAPVLPAGAVPEGARRTVGPIADRNLRREVGVAYGQTGAGSPAVVRILDALGLQGDAACLQR